MSLFRIYSRPILMIVVLGLGLVFLIHHSRNKQAGVVSQQTDSLAEQAEAANLATANVLKPTPSDSLSDQHEGPVDFEVLTDPVWSVPTRNIESETEINLALRIINNTEKVTRIHLFDTIRIAIEDQDGNSLVFDGGRNGTTPGEIVSDPINPGKDLIISRLSILKWHTQNTLRLMGSDDFGGVWYFDGLRTGRYRVQLIHENQRREIGKFQSVWTGTGKTKAIEIEIR